MRKLAKQLRIFFGCRNKYYFDVIKVFEKVNILLPQITTEIVEDDSFDEDIPSRCIPDFHGHFLIQVKERIYNGAIKGCGAHRMHILHEICHVILFEAGFFPFMDRTYKIGELKPFESVEWQAKALAGEMMMPYEETKDKSAKAIKRLCVVSGEASLLRFTNYRKDGEVNN